MRLESVPQLLEICDHKSSHWLGIHHLEFLQQLDDVLPGGLQYCSNNATTPGAPFFNFINPVVRNKLGSDGAVCTSTSSCHSCHLVSWHKSARGSSQLL